MINIKTLFFTAIISTSLLSCGSTEEADGASEKSIAVLYNEFKDSDDCKNLLALNETIQKGIDHEIGFVLLPQDPSKLNELKLDFESNTQAGVFYSPTFIGEKPAITLGRQEKHGIFINALTAGVETYEIPDNDNKEASWSTYQKELTTLTQNSEYYVMVVIKSMILPVAINNTSFESGSFVARVTVLDTKTGKKMGTFDVNAFNSEELAFYEGTNVLYEIRDDFEKNINTALLDGLKQHTKDVKYDKGKPPYIKIAW